MKPALDVPLVMKGAPCSRGNYAPLKTSSKTCISIEVQRLGPRQGLGHRHNLAYFIGQWFGCSLCPTHNTNPAKLVRAWARSRRHQIVDRGTATIIATSTSAATRRGVV